MQFFKSTTNQKLIEYQLQVKIFVEINLLKDVGSRITSGSVRFSLTRGKV